jgi:hypothetical protein
LLRVRCGEHTVTRELGGRDDHTALPVPEADLRDTLGALFGVTYLAFEGYTPAHSVWLDDLITSKLALRPFIDGVHDESQDLAGLIELFESGLVHLPAPLLTTLPPLGRVDGDAPALTYPAGLQTILFQERPVFGAKHLLRRVDVLPLGRVSSVTAHGRETPEERAENARARFDVNLRQTARLAIAEANLGSSTQTQLEGKPLRFLRPGAGKTAFKQTEGLSDDQRARWKYLLDAPAWRRAYLLVPEDGQTLAFWVVDPKTGELTGVLADGSGGGQAAEDIRRQLEQIEREITVLNTLAALTAAAGGVGAIGGAALGVVGNYGQLLARLYAAVSITITLMNADDLEEDVQRALFNFACNVTKTLLYSAFGPVGLAASTMDNVFSLLLGAEHPLACP